MNRIDDPVRGDTRLSRSKSVRAPRTPLRPRYFAVAATVALIAFACGLALQMGHWWSIRAYDGVEPVCRVETQERIVALTFDDGPDPAHTPEVLELLAAQNAHATFFVIGERALEHPRLTMRIVRSDDELGNHTWSHQNLTLLSPKAALTEIERGEKALNSYSVGPLVRAPFGEIQPETLNAIRQQGLTAIHWSLAIDVYVRKLDGAREIAAAIMADVSPGDVILAHDADDGGASRDEAVAALGALMSMLESNGYRMVSVSTLLDGRVPVLASPREWFWQSGFDCPG